MSAFSSFHRIKVEHPKNWWPQLPGMTIFFCCTRHILICLSLQCTAVRWYFECHQLGLCTITNYYYPVKCKDNRASWQWAGAETDYRSFILIFCILWTSDDVLLYERVVDRLPLMTYGLKLSLEAWILEFKNFNLSFKEII